MLKRFFSEPLVHFIVLGMAILVGVELFGDGGNETGSAGDDDSAVDIIRVETGALSDFVQSRTGLTDTTAFAAVWADLDPNARKDWLRRYVREEALVREARKLGLDRDDPLIRRRLVQQMEFLAVGALDGELAPNADQLEDFYSERRADYRLPGRFRFAHVFVRPDENARSRAEGLLGDLNARGATGEEALGEGDRFLYQRLYVDRTVEEVESHFGSAMSRALTRLQVDSERWQGPIDSDHGLHLVLLHRFEAERFPALEEVKESVSADWRRARREALLETAVEEIVSNYEVRLEEEAN